MINLQFELTLVVKLKDFLLYSFTLDKIIQNYWLSNDCAYESICCEPVVSTIQWILALTNYAILTCAVRKLMVMLVMMVNVSISSMGRKGARFFISYAVLHGELLWLGRSNSLDLNDFDGEGENIIYEMSKQTYLRGPLLVNIFWTHKNCLWHYVLAFGSPRITDFLASLPFFLCNFTRAFIFGSLFSSLLWVVVGCPFSCWLYFKVYLLHVFRMRVVHLANFLQIFLEEEFHISCYLFV